MTCSTCLTAVLLIMNQAAAYADVPDWVMMEDFFENLSGYSRSMVLGSLLAGLLLSGLVAPVVEELYFRGYLLPRISRFKLFSPLISVSLFTLYHFYSPWQYPAIFFSFLLIVYLVYLQKNIYLGMVTHGLINSIGILQIILSL